MPTRIQMRRGSSEEWTLANPTLAEGEPGLELDTGKFKFGDGTTAWSDLAYFPASLTTADKATGGTDGIVIKTGDSDDDDGGDILIQGGVGDGGDGGSVIINAGDGDDSDGTVEIQGAITIRKNIVQITKNLEVDYDDGSFQITDGAGDGIGAQGHVIGLLTINRTSVEDAYPDIGSNYILIVSDPATGHAWGVTPAGYEYFDNPTGIGAPDDADLNIHQRRQWYDPTTGAPAFRFKQKDDAGTVTTGKSAAMSSDGAAFLGVDKVSLTAGDAAEIMAALVTLGLVTDDT